ncbi:MAG: WG repeat-containing protein, partial [Cyanothece sp. SIO2G6]|nr:WG repeat-containing protein [Cyanothece sp. SIO2G6]
ESDGIIGFIDKTGEFVIEPQYESVSSFHEGISAVCQEEILDDDRGCGYINPNGDVLMPLTSSLISPFHNGIAWVKKLPSGSLQSIKP